jgi:hypothetical protein
VSNFSLGITPASDSLVAFTMIINRMVVSPLWFLLYESRFLLSLSNEKPGNRQQDFFFSLFHRNSFIGPVRTQVLPAVK